MDGAGEADKGAPHGLHPATPTSLHPGRYRLTLPVYEPGDVYARVCPHNGTRPQLDPTVDPEHCIGD